MEGQIEFTEKGFKIKTVETKLASYSIKGELIIVENKYGKKFVMNVESCMQLCKELPEAIRILKEGGAEE